MGIARLGHVGIHCQDIETQKAFFRDVLGLTVTDEDPEAGFVFLSAQPEIEHHELVLLRGRDVPREGLMLQQISFRCNTLTDVLQFHSRFKAHRVPYDMEATHGNAISIYFYDPEGNRCEVYWDTGLRARQPFLDALDLDQPPEKILARVNELVEKFGVTGHVNHEMLATQNIN